MTGLSDACNAIIDAANYIAKPLIDYGYSCITMNPTLFNSSSGYQLAVGLNEVFATLGTSFATVFFLIDFCSASSDIRQQLTLENIAKFLIKISICNFFIVHAMDIMSKIIKAVTALANIAGNSFNAKYVDSTTYGSAVTISRHFDGVSGSIGEMLSNAAGVENMKTEIASAGFWFQLVLLIIMLVFFGVAVGCGFLMVSTGVLRLFKIYMLIPFASLAFASMAGGTQTEISRTLPGYIKALLGLLLESVAIVIGVRLFFGFATNEIFLANFGVDFAAVPKALYCPLIGANACCTYLFFMMVITMIKNVPKKALSLGDI